MPDRFVITGCGRSGTKYLSLLLTHAGVPCGHERAHNHRVRGVWPAGARADSSWMAATMLDAVGVPVVLLVRHPMRVVASWVEIGFFSDVDAANPTHGPLRAFAPWVYDFPDAHDRALAMWTVLTEAALGRAELLLRLEHVDPGRLGRLLAWCGADPGRAVAALGEVGRVNRHEGMRAKTGIRHQPSWGLHDPDLAYRARRLARALGYLPDRWPDA